MTELEKQLIGVAKLVNDLRKTNGSNAKLELLKYGLDNVPYTKEILELTYDPNLKYGLSKSTVKRLAIQFKNSESNWNFNDFNRNLRYLAASNIDNDLRRQVSVLLGTFITEEVLSLVCSILTKDLQIGMNVKSINKVCPGLIPVFEVMRGEQYDKNKKFLTDKEIIITEKIDGVRCVCVVDENGNCTFWSRQGKEITGLIEIKDEIVKLGCKNIVLDGEITINSCKNMVNFDIFEATSSKISEKNDSKSGLLYNVFDCIPLSKFKEGKCNTTTRARKKYVSEKIEEANVNNDFLISLPILYAGEYDEKIVKDLHQSVVERGGEGLMINIADAPYETKRTKNLLKVKMMYTVDLRIKGFEKGSVGSKFERTLGAIVVDYKGYDVKVGSGYSNEQREYFWKHQNELIGRVIEVQTFAETSDEKGNLSLRFPVFKRLREVGKEVSYD